FAWSISSTVIRGGTRPLSEGLDEHGLAWRDVATLLLEHDETVAGDHRGEDARALWPRGAHLPAAVSPLEDAPLELAPPRLFAHRLGGACLVDFGEEAATTRELVNGRPDEQHEGEHRGDGIAGEAEEVGRPDPSDRERTARLHRDLPELDRADLVEDLLDEVVEADGHAPRGHDDVVATGDVVVAPRGHDDVAGRARVREARAERVADIGDDAEVHDLAAALLDGPAEREPVRVVDLAGRARLTRL